MLLAGLAIVCGLVLLVWSADRFVDGSAATAHHAGMPPLLIGMVVVGFGTSAPEMVVSAISAYQGSPGLALGNAYGSNIFNIGFILGLTALMNPIPIHSQVLRKELPILLGVTVLAAWQARDGELTRVDAWVLLAVFAGLMAWTIGQGLRDRRDALGQEMEQEMPAIAMSLKMALAWLAVGLLLLIASSRMLVWGAVELARGFGVSDLLIGLTIVAMGTSLPELASSLAAARKGEHDIALGNIIGSNLFNTLAVVGLAGAINPMRVAPEVLNRDILGMGIFTISLVVMGYGSNGVRRINRVAGAGLLAADLAYMAWLVAGSLPGLHAS